MNKPRALDQSLPHVVTANETETLFTGLHENAYFTPQRRAPESDYFHWTASVTSTPRFWPLGASDEYHKRTLRAMLCYAMRGRGVTQQEVSALSCVKYSGSRLNLRLDLCVIICLQQFSLAEPIGDLSLLHSEGMESRGSAVLRDSDHRIT